MIIDLDTLAAIESRCISNGMHEAADALRSARGEIVRLRKIEAAVMRWASASAISEQLNAMLDLRAMLREPTP